MRRTGSVIVVVLLASTSALAAQQSAGGRDQGRLGAFVLGLDQHIGAGKALPAPLRQSALALAGTVLAIVRRDPAVSTPLGYDLRVHRAVGSTSDWGHFDSGMPFFAGAFGTFFDLGARPSRTASKGADFAVMIAPRRPSCGRGIRRRIW